MYTKIQILIHTIFSGEMYWWKYFYELLKLICDKIISKSNALISNKHSSFLKYLPFLSSVVEQSVTKVVVRFWDIWNYWFPGLCVGRATDPGGGGGPRAQGRRQQLDEGQRQTFPGKVASHLNDCWWCSKYFSFWRIRTCFVLEWWII